MVDANAPLSEATQIAAAIRRLGYDVVSVRDLIASRVRYHDAIPILADFLHRTTNPSLKEDIVRTLSVPWAKGAAADLAREFRAVDDPTGFGIRWAIGNALEVTASPLIRDELLALAKDSTYGPARQMIVLGLAKLKGDPEVVATLVALLKDPDVAGHAVMALGRVGDKDSASAVRSLQGHPQAWIRQQVRMALAKLERRSA